MHEHVKSGRPTCNNQIEVYRFWRSPKSNKLNDNKIAKEKYSGAVLVRVVEGMRKGHFFQREIEAIKNELHIVSSGLCRE